MILTERVGGAREVGGVQKAHGVNSDKNGVGFVRPGGKAHTPAEMRDYLFEITTAASSAAEKAYQNLEATKSGKHDLDPESQSRTTFLAVGVVQGHIVHAHIGDSPLMYFIKRKNGQIEYGGILNELHNYNPLATSKLAGHFLGAEHLEQLKNSPPGKYSNTHALAGLISDGEELILVAGSDGLTDPVTSVPGNPLDYTFFSKINVEQTANSAEHKAQLQAQKDAAIARLEAANKELAARYQKTGERYAEILQRAADMEAGAQGLAETLIVAERIVAKENKRNEGQWDDVSVNVIRLSLKDLPDEPIISLIADGNGDDGSVISEAAMKAAETYISPIPGVNERIANAHVRIEAARDFLKFQAVHDKRGATDKADPSSADEMKGAAVVDVPVPNVVPQINWKPAIIAGASAAALALAAASWFGVRPHPAKNNSDPTSLTATPATRREMPKRSTVSSPLPGKFEEQAKPPVEPEDAAYRRMMRALDGTMKKDTGPAQPEPQR